MTDKYNSSATDQSPQTSFDEKLGTTGGESTDSSDTCDVYNWSYDVRQITAESSPVSDSLEPRSKDSNKNDAVDSSSTEIEEKSQNVTESLEISQDNRQDAKTKSPENVDKVTEGSTEDASLGGSKFKFKLPFEEPKKQESQTDNKFVWKTRLWKTEPKQTNASTEQSSISMEVNDSNEAISGKKISVKALTSLFEKQSSSGSQTCLGTVVKSEKREITSTFEKRHLSGSESSLEAFVKPEKRGISHVHSTPDIKQPSTVQAPMHSPFFPTPSVNPPAEEEVLSSDSKQFQSSAQTEKESENKPFQKVAEDQGNHTQAEEKVSEKYENDEKYEFNTYKAEEEKCEGKTSTVFDEEEHGKDRVVIEGANIGGKPLPEPPQSSSVDHTSLKSPETKEDQTHSDPVFKLPSFLSTPIHVLDLPVEKQTGRRSVSPKEPQEHGIGTPVTKSSPESVPFMSPFVFGKNPLFQPDVKKSHGWEMPWHQQHQDSKKTIPKKQDEKSPKQRQRNQNEKKEERAKIHETPAQHEKLRKPPLHKAHEKHIPLHKEHWKQNVGKGKKVESKMHDKKPHRKEYIFCVRGLAENVERNALIRFLKSKSKCDFLEADLLFLPKKGVAVFTIDGILENTENFMAKVRKDALPDSSNKLDICETSKPKSITVSCHAPLDESLLKACFERESCTIRQCQEVDFGCWKADFETAQDVDDVINSAMEQKIAGKLIHKTVCYDTEFGQFWDEQKHIVPLPDRLLWKEEEFVLHNELILKSENMRGRLNTTLSKHHGEISIDEEIYIQCLLTQSTPDVRKLVPDWEIRIRNTVMKFFNEETKKEKITVEKELWPHMQSFVSEKKESLIEKIHVHIQECSEHVNIEFVGEKEKAIEFDSNLTTKIEETKYILERSKIWTKEEIPLEPHELKVMNDLKLFDDITGFSEDLEMKVNESSNRIILEGVPDDIQNAKALIKVERETIHVLQYSYSNLSQQLAEKELVNLLQKNKDIFEQLKSGWLRKNIVFCVLENALEDKALKVCCHSDFCEDDLFNDISTLLSCSDVKIRDDEEKTVLNSEGWSRECSKWISQHEHELLILKTADGYKVWSSPSILQTIDTSLKNFIQKEAVYNEKVPIQEDLKQRFIERYGAQTLSKLIDSNKCKFEIKKNEVLLSANKDTLKTCVPKVKDYLKNIEKKKKEITFLGVKKHLQKNPDIATGIMSRTQTIVEIDPSQKITESQVAYSLDNTFIEQDFDEPILEDLPAQSIPIPDTTSPADKGKNKEPIKCKNGTNIFIKRERLENQHVDVIVTTVDASCDLSKSACAKSLITKDGSLQALVTKQFTTGIKNGEIGEISAAQTQGKISCKEIYFTTLPPWEQDQTVLTNFMKCALQKAAAKSYNTISFSAIGTGKRLYPVPETAERMYAAVQNYDDSVAKSSLEVFFVIPRDSIVKYETFLDQHYKVLSNENEDCLKTPNGMEILLKEGFIGNMKHDVLVCGIGNNMQLSAGGGVSQGLLKTSFGKNLQTEMDKKFSSGIKDGDVAVVPVAGTMFKAFMFLSLPGFEKEKEVKEDSTTLYKSITKCLEMAETNGWTSLVFPALGTGGGLKYGKDFVAKLMFNAFTEYSKKHSSSKIRKVTIALWQGDVETTNALTKELKQRTGAKGKIPSGPKEYNISSSVKIRLCDDNILNEKADVIVCSSSSDLNLTRGGVSKFITEAAGSAVMDESQNKYPNGIKEKEVAVLGSGSLANFKAIYAVTLTSYTADKSYDKKKILVETMTNILKAADTNKATSIAIPALGTGFLNFPANIVAFLLFGAVKSFVNHHRKSSLKKIIFFYRKDDTNVSKAFCREIQKRQKLKRHVVKTSKPVSPKPVSRRANRQYRFNPELGEDVTPSTHQTKRDKKKPAVDPMSTVEVFITADDNQKADEAFARLNKKLQKKYTTDIYKDTLIKELTDEQIDEIMHLKQSFDVEMDIQKSSCVINLTGFPDEKGNLKEKLHECFQHFQLKKHEYEEADIVANYVQWYFMQKIQGVPTRTRYAKIISMKLESTLKKGFPDFKFLVNNKKRAVTMNNMKELEIGNPKGEVYDVIRCLVQSDEHVNVEYPETWTNPFEMSQDKPMVVKLDKTSPEFKTVEQNFLNSVQTGKFTNRIPNVQNLTVTDIERIQNKFLWKQYCVRKSFVESNNPGMQDIERKLWHGTDKKATVSINYYGFNRSYCGKNGTWFGEGVYFSNDASYSARGWVSPQSPTGVQHMYLSRVLTGNFCQGVKDMRFLPPLPTNNQLNYDSAVEDLNNPTEFMIFHDNAAYPEYLLYFKF